MPERLGQHFLTNKQKLREIAENLDLKPSGKTQGREDDTIIEIGPGHGELTKELRIENSECRIICIEKDSDLADELESLGLNNLEVIKGDALKIIPKLCSTLQASSFKITGNIPYYITGYLFRILGELENKPSLIVFTIQKEVAERITARPPRMNLLAASIQFWAEPKIIEYISKSDFQPEPKVDSAIIRLDIKNQTVDIRKLKELSDKYYRFIKIIFKQPRKTILNNLISGLKNINKEEIMKKLEKAGVNPADRPQNLEITQLLELSTLF